MNIFCFLVICILVSQTISQNPCQIISQEQISFQIIGCTYYTTDSVFFIKIDLLTSQDGVVANYWNSQITRKDSLIPLQIMNQFIQAGQEPHKINTNTTLLMPNAIKSKVNGKQYEWNLRLCNYNISPTGLNKLFAKCDLKFGAKLKISLRDSNIDNQTTIVIKKREILSLPSD